MKRVHTMFFLWQSNGMTTIENTFCTHYVKSVEEELEHVFIKAFEQNPTFILYFVRH